ncbi:MAG: Zn-dependent hydrolase [Chloroflexi bacterium]|nr:Zn-dependent hydrolase [Chloroflexota bacterium]
MNANKDRLARRIAELSAIGGHGDAVTRLGLTLAEAQAQELVASWLRARGAAIRTDEARNVYGRFGGPGPAVLVGSHLDSVPEGGRYDGALGVLCAVEAVDTILDAGRTLRRPLEVVGWCDEEGARFGIGLFGSTAAFGRLPAKAAERRDRDGISIADALRALGASGDPERARYTDPLSAYLELHIEQGPRLETRGIPLGVVSDIVGIFHGLVRVTGRADHAGATVMGARKDALAGAAEMALGLERIASAMIDAVGTVGEIAVRPGAKNVVPGQCTFSIDVRAPDQERVDAVLRAFRVEARRICDARGLTFLVDQLASVPPVPMDAKLTDLFLRSAKAVGVDAPLLVSGAGHDTSNPALGGVPSGMLFVRSTGGSHTPTEHASVEDATLGATVLAIALAELCG